MNQPTRDLRDTFLPCNTCSGPTPALQRTIAAIDSPEMFDAGRILHVYSAVCPTCIERIYRVISPRKDARCAMCPEPCYGQRETTHLLLLTAKQTHYVKLCKRCEPLALQLLGYSDQEKPPTRAPLAQQVAEYSAGL